MQAPQEAAVLNKTETASKPKSRGGISEKFGDDDGLGSEFIKKPVSRKRAHRSTSAGASLSKNLSSDSPSSYFSSRDSLRDSLSRDSLSRDSLSRGSSSRDSLLSDSLSSDSLSSDSSSSDSVSLRQVILHPISSGKTRWRVQPGNCRGRISRIKPDFKNCTKY